MYRFEIWVSRDMEKDRLDGLKELLKKEFGTSVEERDIRV
jgi:hypothetical protein